MKKLFTGCLTAIGAIVVLGVVIVLFSGSGDDTESDASNQNEQETASKQNDDNSGNESDESEVEKAGIGEKATVSNVGFTVNDVRTTKEIDSGNEFTENPTTDGQFVIVDVSIENNKDESITIDSSYFQLITDDGTTYDPTTDGAVTMAIDPDNEFFLQQINPGLSKSGSVVFEVAEDVDAESSVLHAQTGFFGTESIEISLQ